MLVGLLCGIQPGEATVCPTSTLEQLDLPNRTAFKPTALRQLDSKGTLHALVVFSRFQNEDNGNSAAPDFARQIFDPQRPGSLTHFYLEMSKGQFLLTGEHLPKWYTSAEPGSAYVNESGLGGFVDFVWEILTQVDEETDLGLYDNDGSDGLPNSGDDDGFVDLIFINTLSAPRGFILGNATGIAILGIYPEFVSDDAAANGGFIKIRGDNDPAGVGGVVLRGHTFEVAVGTMAHEFGHMLGLPDLHDLKFEDPEQDSAGIGYWELMAHGARGWFEKGGPNPFSAWSLEQLEWIGVDNEDLAVVEESLDNVVFEDVNAGGKVYKVPSKTSFLYYLVEHRRAGTSYYERDLPASRTPGLARRYTAANKPGGVGEEGRPRLR